MQKKDEIIRMGLALAPDERAEVAGALLESLDETPPDDPELVRSEWEAEILRRQEDFLTGREEGKASAEVLEELDELLSTARRKR